MKTALKITNPIKKLETMRPTFINYLTFAFLILFAVTGCKKGAEDGTTGNFNKSTSAFTDTGAPAATAVLPNVIPSGFTFAANTTYLIDGPTFVPSGVTLTIPAGTFIKGKKVSTSGKPSFLLVTKGGKLIANGTQAAPIRFTSDQPACSRAAGDWAGVVILGQGITNAPLTTLIEGVDATMVPANQSTITYPASFQYGGSDENDLAGQSSLKYVRIEFAGAILTADKELNGLTLGAVGASTTLSNIEVSYGADDAFEFFGGSVNAKYLIAYANNDDDFDFDQGYQGSIQFALGVKLACASGYSSNPNGIECNNITSPVTTINSRVTHPILSNFTLLGHSASPGPIQGSGSSGIGALFRAGTEFTFVNFLIGGFGVGVNYGAAATSPAPVYRDGAIQAFTTPSTPAAPASVLTQVGGVPNDLLALNNPFNTTCSCTVPLTPNFTTSDPISGGTLPAVTHAGGVFPSGTLDATGLSFQGAMGSTRWDLGTYWTSYNPQGNPN